MLPTKIPFFRSVMVSSFACEHCSYKNTELFQLGDLQPKGTRISVIIKTKKVSSISTCTSIGFFSSAWAFLSITAVMCPVIPSSVVFGVWRLKIVHQQWNCNWFIILKNCHGLFVLCESTKNGHVMWCGCSILKPTSKNWRCEQIPSWYGMRRGIPIDEFNT
jgi:hypothetical protein